MRATILRVQSGVKSEDEDMDSGSPNKYEEFKDVAVEDGSPEVVYGSEDESGEEPKDPVNELELEIEKS